MNRVLFAIIIIVAICAGLTSYTNWQSHRQDNLRLEALKTQVPDIGREKDFVSSDTCQSCHPGEYHSWHRTYHRTMTQLATDDNIEGVFDGTEIISHGMKYTVFRSNEMNMVRMPDPDLVMAVAEGKMKKRYEDIPHIERQVVMATGSHHYQTYWVQSPRMKKLMQTLPLVYLIKDRQWIPRENAFMRPPNEKGDFITQWNHHCIRCHSTGGNPNLQPPGTPDEGLLLSEVGEMGISCEACHGPGEQHIAFHRNPVNRYTKRSTGFDGDSIINPARIDHKRSSEICGQCHGVYIDAGIEAEKYRFEGIHFKPGEDISQYRYYVFHPESKLRSEETSRSEWEQNKEFYTERWWEDGRILAGGREYTAQAATACFKDGTMSCMSCHTMHDGDPADQLNPALTEQQMCIQCHDQPQYTTNITEHTKHSANSSGSQCMNCHMPRTAYALFGALRNHQIESPDMESISRHNVPNACNLCHLDKTLAWTRDNLVAQYGMDSLPVPDGSGDVAASVFWLLQGDAKRRAIAAWHMGWDDARKISGSEWMVPFLSIGLQDPYGVVRYISRESLKSIRGFEEFEYNFLDDRENLRKSSELAVRQWLTNKSPIEGVEGNDAVLVRPDRTTNQARIRELVRNRDHSPVSISE